MSKIYRCSLEVRAYELDAFGHVNNAQYLHYLEVARWSMLRENHITLEQIRAWDRWPVITRIDIQYLKPAYSGDQIEVRTRPLDQGKVTFSLSQEIFRGDTLIAQARVESAIVDGKGRPARLPAEYQNIWSPAVIGSGI